MVCQAGRAIAIHREEEAEKAKKRGDERHAHGRTYYATPAEKRPPAPPRKRPTRAARTKEAQ